MTILNLDLCEGLRQQKELMYYSKHLKIYQMKVYIFTGILVKCKVDF